MNQKWTKLIALFLVMLMLFSVVSCVALGGGNETSESESEETPTEMTDEETEI